MHQDNQGLPAKSDQAFGLCSTLALTLNKINDIA